MKTLDSEKPNQQTTQMAIDSRKKERHGMCRTPEYKTWQHLKDRCLNPREKSYSYYGGRGITVCDEWRDSFIAFYRSVGKRPSSEHSIDRIDVDGNYEPGNVRWVERDVQNHNRRFTGNQSGIKGVQKLGDSWQPRITRKGKTYYLGVYKDKMEAAKVYEQARNSIYGY